MDLLIAGLSFFLVLNLALVIAGGVWLGHDLSQNTPETVLFSVELLSVSDNRRNIRIRKLSDGEGADLQHLQEMNTYLVDQELPLGTVPGEHRVLAFEVGDQGRAYLDTRHRVHRHSVAPRILLICPLLVLVVVSGGLICAHRLVRVPRGQDHSPKTHQG